MRTSGGLSGSSNLYQMSFNKKSVFSPTESPELCLEQKLLDPKLR